MYKPASFIYVLLVDEFRISTGRPGNWTDVWKMETRVENRMRVENGTARETGNARDNRNTREMRE